MDPAQLIPTPDTIPVPWGWFEFLLLLTFVLHLLFMNTMLGSGIISFISHFKRGEKNTSLAKDVSKKLPYTIAFTVNMGVAPLLFLQVLYGHFIYVSSVLMAVYWLSIFVLLIIAYYSAYIYDFKYEGLGSFRPLFIGGTVVILLFIGFMFTNNMTMMLHPEKWKAYFDRPGGTLLNLSDPTLIPRYLHFIFASIAVGGLFIALIAWFKTRKGSQGQEDPIAHGMRWFTHATMIQVIIGLWFLMTLPSHLKMRFMGGDTFCTLMFLLGVAGTIVSLVFGFKQRVPHSAISVIVTIIFMVIMRDLLRWGYLNKYFIPSSLTVIPQYSPMILFLCCFVISIVIVGYMLKLAFRAGKGA